MLKFDKPMATRYSEVSQVNPIRWTICHKEGETLTAQSGLIKCKDFFNDIVAWHKEKYEFPMYGFKNKVNFNEEGLWFVLSSISDPVLFKENLAVLNSCMPVPMIIEEVENKNSCAILIPMCYWESTYYISLISFLVRLCNYGYKYTDWDSFFNTNAPMYTAEHAFSTEGKALAKEWKFEIPKKYSFWYFAGKDFNSSKAPKTPSTSIIHNNGVSSWAMYVKQGTI